MAKDKDSLPYYKAAGGIGSMEGIAKVFRRERPVVGVLDALWDLNKTGGLACTSCAWGKPANPSKFEFCENGAKATIWDLTRDRCTPDFFAKHTLTELREWQDYDLEMQGRLTAPMRYDPATDKYVECGWDEAFAGIAAALKPLPPKSVIFYASGKASLETSYLWALLARRFGNNNLPDSSNMCHETTSVALRRTIGVGFGSTTLEDFETCDVMLYFGQNPGTNSPRFLHPLQEGVKRGMKLIVFNPVREVGLLRFINPQNPVQMLTQKPTDLAHLYHQVKPGGDISVVMGMAKRLLELERQRGGVIDHDFIARHTNGWDSFRASVEAANWGEIEHHSGLTRADLEAAADIYAKGKRGIAVYGMGITQQVHGAKTIGLIVNLLMMRGNIGRPGAGICPVRGHSNVQGQRTVGIADRVDTVPLDRIAEQYGFDPPRENGLNAVEMCEGLRAGTVKAFLGLGGNLARAVPDQDRVYPFWVKQDITVSIATKLNRTHLLPGKVAYLLPCLTRPEEDRQASGPQALTIEDTFSFIHGSIGKRAPASDKLKSEVAIIAGIAAALGFESDKMRWREWTGDYARIRDQIEGTYPEQFRDFNGRMWTPGGFFKGNPVRERIWKTPSGKAEFTTAHTLTALGVGAAPGRFHLITMRSNDQFNTTIYGFDDRLRGLKGSRMILLINPRDMERAGLSKGQTVSLIGDAGDQTKRRVDGLTVTPFNLPDGCVGGYYPECNPLVPLWYHDEESGTPAAKGVPVRIEAV